MKRLLHIIESLGVGGAEQLVVGVINGLDGFEHHLIILNEPDQLRSHITRGHFYKNLHIKSKIDLLLSARKVRKYIRDNKIDIVHAHLYWAIILSRLAVPKEIPVFNSIHAISSLAAYEGNRLTLYLERLTYRKRHHIVAVSAEVLKDFSRHVRLSGHATVLYNFIDEDFFIPEQKRNFSKEKLKLVAVGNLRQQKNYPYLLEAFRKVPPSVSLDIYGEGPLRNKLQKYIDEHKLPVQLCGLSDRLPELLPRYDAFVMSSFFEGQPLSLLEAMAAGLPAILSDIPVLREVTGSDALYFDINDTDSFGRVIQQVLNGDVNMENLSEASRRKVNSFAHRDQYFERLKALYNQTDRGKVRNIKNDKPTIIQIINDLGRGGAETLLVGILKDLSQHYNIILVTLTRQNEFDEQEISCTQWYYLDYDRMLELPKAVLKLRRIIKKHKPVLVVSHLYWSTIIARLAKPAKTPLIFSVHQILSEGAFDFNRKGSLLRWLDRRTYKKNQVLVGVSQQVIEDYDKQVGIRGDYHVLHNYVADVYFQNSIDYQFSLNGQLRLVAVGNPKWEKNFELLPEAFRYLDKNSVSCDIYGQSEYGKVVDKKIAEYAVPVYQKGKTPDIYNKLKNYHAFIMCSRSEGFGIAAAEAMAIGLPLILTDLKVLREISHNNAIFFHTENAQELAEKIREFQLGKYDTKKMSELGKKISRENYSKSGYLQKLLDIYHNSIIHNA